MERSLLPRRLTLSSWPQEPRGMYPTSSSCIGVIVGVILGLWAGKYTYDGIMASIPMKDWLAKGTVITVACVVCGLIITLFYWIGESITN